MTRPDAQLVRLQKFLSDAGVASRRQAEEMILEGHVLVNDQVVQELPAFVNPQRDKVVVDGDRVRVQPHRYYILNKPTGVVCTNRDPAGRRRAVDFLPPQAGRLFVVGRLDVDSSGLLLLTNDGELAARVTHPRYGMPKTYEVEVRGQVDEGLAHRLTEGIYLAEGRVRADYVEVRQRSRQRSALRITVHEGLNRMVRRMLARVGHEVRALTRIRVGPLTLKGLPAGGCRALSSAEVEALRSAVARAEANPKTGPAVRRNRGRRSTGGPPPPSGRPPRRDSPGPRRDNSTPRRPTPPAEPKRRVVR